MISNEEALLNSRWLKWSAPILIFVAALVPRVIALGATLTADEHLWLERSANFIEALKASDWTGTFQSGHPGVTTMWMSGSALGWLGPAATTFAEKLAVAQLPIALMTSLGILLVFFFLKAIFDFRVAALSALFLALNPTFIAHCRVVHLDAVVTTFMVLSVLSLLAHLKDTSKSSYLFITGIFTGLALLTKLPSVFLCAFIPFTIVLWHFLGRLEFKGKESSPTVTREILAVGVVAAITYCVVWPSMWTAPVATVTSLFTTAKVATAVPAGSGFFLGEVSTGTYGASYYPIVLFMRSTPVTVLFALISLVYFVKDLRTNGLSKKNKTILVLILYILLFTIQMSVGSKKADRYILPALPVVDILAVLGFFSVCDHLATRFFKFCITRIKYGLSTILSILVLSSQATLSLPLHPYYMAYFNPLLGGSSRAAEVLVVGWGEGMDQAARYLNEKPNAKDLTVAALYYGFEQYFDGKTIGKGKNISLEELASADYVVFYVSYVQRGIQQDIWDHFKARPAEKVITLNHLNYAYIYKNDLKAAIN